MDPLDVYGHTLFDGQRLFRGSSFIEVMDTFHDHYGHYPKDQTRGQWRRMALRNSRRTLQSMMNEEHMALLVSDKKKAISLAQLNIIGDGEGDNWHDDWVWDEMYFMIHVNDGKYRLCHNAFNVRTLLTGFGNPDYEQLIDGDHLYQSETVWDNLQNRYFMQYFISTGSPHVKMITHPNNEDWMQVAEQYEKCKDNKYELAPMSTLTR